MIDEKQIEKWELLAKVNRLACKKSDKFFCTIPTDNLADLSDAVLALIEEREKSPWVAVGELLETTFDCPFCGEKDFDAIGVKHHLINHHCEVFESIRNIRGKR